MNLPGALVIARDWAMSEQKGDMMADPAGTGARHAWEWSEKADALGYDPANTLMLGINEPPVWDAGVIPALVAYTVAFLDGCSQHGLRGGALQLSVGWPANNGDGTPPDWAPYAGVEAAIKRGKHALVVHEYWADQGPGENWGWWCGRWMSCPWDVPVIIGETGIDMYVKHGGGYSGTRGWTGQVDSNRYAAECAEYVRLCQDDPRFFAATPFTTDYANQEWGSFDTNPARNELYSAARALEAAQWYSGGAIAPEPPTPTPPQPSGLLVHPLPAGIYRITQKFNETHTNPKGHDGTDFGAKEGTPLRSIADGNVAWVDDDPAGYGRYMRLWHPSLNVYSFYAHLAAQGNLHTGDLVTAGQVIGAVGNTGNSSGPHLHFEIRIADGNGEYSAVAPKGNGRCDPETFCALYGLKL